MVFFPFLFVSIVWAASSPWTQTDWSGGSGQTSWSDNTMFSAGSGVTTSTAGQVTLTSTEELSNTGFETDLSSWDTGAQPDSISGLQVWFKADAITGLNDTDAIATWSDSSVNSRDATQAVGVSQPFYRTNQLNSLPIVRFGGGDFLTLGDVELHSNVSGLSIFAVQSTNDAFDSPVVGKYDAGNNEREWTFNTTLWSLQDAADVFDANNSATYAVSSGWVIDSGVWTPATRTEVFRGGASLATATTPATDITDTAEPLLLGANTAGATTFNGDVAEIIIYNTALSNANRSRIENYLRDKYNITVSSGITSLTRNTTTTYNSSNGSARAITATSDTGELTQTLNVGDTNNYNLSVYAYTDGSAVTSSNVELFYNGSTVTTTYTSVGSGWYRLTGTVTGANASRQYGVQVKVNQTVYLDDFSLISYTASATLTSSIFDSGQGSNWGTLTYTATTPTNTTAGVKLRSSNSSSMTGATDFSSCSSITSGDDVSSDPCVTDGQRYIQYQIVLSTTDTSQTSTFQDFSLAFAASATPTPAPTSAPAQLSVAGPPTCEAIAPKTTPWLYSAGVLSNNSVLLKFTGINEALDKYVLEYGIEPGKYIFSAANIGAVGTTEYKVGYLSPGETYYFRVRADNGCATGSWSNEISTTTKGFVSLISNNQLETNVVDVEEKPVEKTEQEKSTEKVEELKKEEDDTEVKIESKNVDLKLKVVDSENKPVEGAEVVLHSEPRIAYTNKDGYVFFEDVETGEHEAIISYNGQNGKQIINLKEDDQIEQVDFTIKIEQTNPFLDSRVLIVISSLILALICVCLLLIRKRLKRIFKNIRK